MMLTAINFLPPAIARIPLELVQTLGLLAFYGIPDVIALTLLILDWRRNGRLNVVFAAGVLLMIASHPIRIVFSGTETWLGFAAWLTR